MECRKFRIMIVGDQGGIRAMLETTDDIEVVGEEATEDETINKVRSIKPDAVLMDISTLLMNSLEATGRIQIESPETKVLVLADYEDLAYVLPLIKAGASGFIVKTAASVELTQSIRSICRGDSYLSPMAARVLVHNYWQVKRKRATSRDQFLTFRQSQVLRLLAQGHTTKEIAIILTMGRSTVERCKTSLLNDLGIKNRGGLVEYAIRKGMITIS